MSRKKLGKYEIIERIGRGGMAEVYRGYHVALDRYVAIKLLHPFLADDPEFKDRFENEARNVAKLKHQKIVQVYDFEYDEEGDSYYMVMEMINGPTLKDKLFELTAAGTRFPVAEAVRITRSAAEALAYAHQRNMIHRDVKPANLMLDEDNRIVLTDFGIAKIVTSAQFTASGGMIGTPAYMAPEQGLGEPGDERSDIYSLGVILFQMLTDHLPFDADSPLAIILKHVNDPIPSLREFVPDLTDDLDNIVQKALAKEPEERYQTAMQMVEDLAMLDENGNRRLVFDTQQLYIPAAPIRPADSQPSPPPERDEALLASGYMPPGATDTHTMHMRSAVATPRGQGRLRPVTILGLLALLVILSGAGIALFGRDNLPLGSVLNAGSDPETPIPTQTLLVAAEPTATNTSEPSATPTTTLTPTEEVTMPVRVSPTPVPTRAGDTLPGPATRTQTPSPESTTQIPATETSTPSLTPTEEPTNTPEPSPTMTPTPNLTATASWLFFEAQARATATPNLTQTLAACEFEFIVVAPARYNVPPAVNDVRNPRLIRAGTDFELEIILRNTGTCGWPEGSRLSFNEELTFAPDDSVDLTGIEDACPSVTRTGLNFATQQQSNFYLNGSVDITAESAPVVFTGTAPATLGCYYGVWDVIYPNSDVTIGRPLLLTIRAWGG